MDTKVYKRKGNAKLLVGVELDAAAITLPGGTVLPATVYYHTIRDRHGMRAFPHYGNPRCVTLAAGRFHELYVEAETELVPVWYAECAARIDRRY